MAESNQSYVKYDDRETHGVHVAPILDELGNEPHFPSSKSVENMESIILETSPLDDESEEEADNVELGEIVVAVEDLDLIKTATSTPLPKLTTGDSDKIRAKPLAQYFQDSDEGGSGDFFDTLQSIPTTEITVPKQDRVANQASTVFEDPHADAQSTLVQFEAERQPHETCTPTSPVKSVTFADESSDGDDLAQKKEGSFEAKTEFHTVEGSNVGDSESTRVRHTSVSEETNVAFEESKGLGTLPTTPSTKNLSKFFTDDGGSNDSFGKSFFDSFTVSEGGQEPGDVPRPSVTHSVSQESQADSVTDSLPPETPPIPGVSPFHSQPQTPLAGVEDVFSKSVRTSDEDRRYDAWIASEQTQHVLIKVATSAAGLYIPEPDHITMPGIIVDEELGDPLRDLVRRYCGEMEALNRHSLTADSVPQNEDGLRQLISAECYRAAVDLCTLLLTECGQGVKALNTPTKHTPYTLQLWFVRISLFMKLRLYAHAESECQAFGTLDKPDLYYEYYREAYPGRRGSMVPFEMRVLHAILPLYLGKTQESLDRLYYLYAIASQILQNLESGLAEDGSMIQFADKSRAESRKLWQRREIQLLYSKVNCLLNIKDYSTALSIFDMLLKKDQSHKSALLCAIARVYLQMGDVLEAQSYFEQAEAKSDSNLDPFTKSGLFMNKGFSSLGKGDFSSAQQYFKQSVQADATNIVAINNMAVCSLYNGKLKEALTTLENLVNSDPSKYLQEGILFNLCTLYELESSHATNKKKKLLNLVSQHKGNGFNAACLKLA